ncbi:MAG: hypothetical protein ACRDKB_07670 [Actinomycetota bacterium]
MGFRATVLRVLIASPSDTTNARVLLREVVEDWNSLHSEDAQIVLLPLMWERDSTPEMGDRPQAILNRQLVDRADLLIGTFWTRLGTPTGEGESGTAEEIEKCAKEGKPTLIYFSEEPVRPDSVDPDEYKRLVAFRDRLKAQGLFDTFESLEELRRKASAALTRTIRERFDADVSEAPVPLRRGAELVARVENEREVRGFSKSGRPQYTTRHTLIIENRGTGTAEGLSFEFVVPDGAEGEAPHIFEEHPVTRLAPGGSLSYNLIAHMGTTIQFDIVIKWREGETEFEDVQTLRL